MGGNSNIILPPAPPLQSSLPPMTNSGALNTPQPLGTPPVEPMPLLAPLLVLPPLLVLGVLMLDAKVPVLGLAAVPELFSEGNAAFGL